MQQQSARPSIKAVPIETTPLPEHRQKQIEAGLAQFQSVLAERDRAERGWNEAVAKIAMLEQQLSSLNGVVLLMEKSFEKSKADLEQRVREYQQQRDHAVARAATLDAHLMNAYTLIKNAVEPEPT